MPPASALHLNQDSHSIEFKLGGIGQRGGARGEGGAEDQWLWEEKSLQEAGTPEESPFENSFKARPG